MMKISNIDFGPVDARHAFTHSDFDENIFSRVFIDPMGVDIHDLEKGRRSFVYGIKGSGKSAILKYLEIKLRNSCETRFVYFSDSIREVWQQKKQSLELPTAEVSDIGNPEEYWRSFLFILIAKIIFEGKGAINKRFLEFVRRQATHSPGSHLDKIIRKAPTVQTWMAEIGSSAKAKLDGSFEEIVSADHFFSSAISLLGEKKLQRKIFVFVDELELVYSNQKQFQKDVELASALVRVIRDLNEAFRKHKIDIFICCAVRKEISDRILGGDASKIIADLGMEVTWERPSWSHDDPDYIHPLFQIALRRIFFSENAPTKSFGKSEIEEVKGKYFPFYRSGGRGSKGTQAEILDLTTYRPRDISILFNTAKKIDKERNSFRQETFRRLIRKPLKDALWRDFSEGLRAEFSQHQIDLLARVLDRLPERFNFSDFKRAIDDFSQDPEMVKIIDLYDDSKWAEILKELYKLGALGNVEKGEKISERYKFFFRGYTSGLILANSVDIIKQKALVEA